MKRFISFLLLLSLCLGGFALGEEKGLKLGDSGPEVLELNTRLRQLNYTSVRAGEQYTAATQTAVSAVQAAYGLEETGEADARTLEIIYGDCYRPLRYGDSGEDVKLLQEKLTELGYYWGSASGNFLEGTTAAIQTFQGENGLEITGTADVKTQEALFALMDRPTPSPTPTPSPSPVPTASPTPGPYREFKKSLSYGYTGSEVPLVQQRLMDLGFFTYHKTTNNYMRQTQAAVKQFQEYNGLDVTGTVDEATWNALFNETDVVDSASTPRPERPKDYFFEVDVNNQVVKVWKYSEETQDYTILDRAFLCATGTKKYPSPLGTFTLSGERRSHCKFPNWGGGEGRYWTKITPEIAFHSVLYVDSSDYTTLKVASLTGLGKRGSHGCIRLTLADAKWIYEHAKKGMKVWIHEDAEADPELRYAIKPGDYDASKYAPKTTPAPTPFPAYDGAQPPATEMRALSVGKSGEDVYWLQMKLKEQGFYTGTVTGQYREGTQSAVKAYQRARGLSADGAAGKQTLQTLYDEARSQATPTPSPED